MSRVVIAGLDHKSVGEFDAICTLGYSLGGNPGVSAGTQASIEIPEHIFKKPWLDFGAAAIVQPEDLPPYMGMIDTPWTAKRPVTATVYDAEYFWALRQPDTAVKLTGSVARIIEQMISIYNSFGDMYIRLGTVGDVDTTQREETLDIRSFWDQLQALALRSGTEFALRPARDADGRWILYMDIARRIGADTEFEISDGERGNMTVRNAQVRGKIINRMVGINNASTATSRLVTPSQTNPASAERYRVRSEVVQYQNVVNLSTLISNTQNNLLAASWPYLELKVDVKNRDHGWLNLRPGNSVIAHASSIVLPRGVRGWRGRMRIAQMAYNERSNSVGMTLLGVL